MLLITFLGNFDPRGIVLFFPPESKSFIIDEGVYFWSWMEFKGTMLNGSCYADVLIHRSFFISWGKYACFI